MFSATIIVSCFKNLQKNKKCFMEDNGEKEVIRPEEALKSIASTFTTIRFSNEINAEASVQYGINYRINECASAEYERFWYQRRALNLLLMDTDEQLKQLFAACDRNGKGYIVEDELQELCLGLGISVTDSNAIFADLDVDNDGKITFEDFSSGFQEFLNPEEPETQTFKPSHRRRASMWSVSVDLNPILEKERKPLDEIDFEMQIDDQFQEQDWNDLTDKRKKQENIYQAWTTFTSTLIESNLLSLSAESRNQINQLYKDLRCTKVPATVATQVDSTVTSLMKEMEKLQKQNKTLEELYNKEKTTHVKTLQSLEYEMEDQFAKVEEMAKEKAQIEKEEEKRALQEQMDQEVAEMQAHLKIFKKVDSWLKNEQWTDEDRINQVRKKLDESNMTNRELRKTLTETGSDLMVLKSDMAHYRLQYEEKCRELHQEREQVLEYMHQYDHLRRQLDLIHSANKRLQDTNDSLRQNIEMDFQSPSMSRTSSFRSSFKRNLKGSRSLSPVPAVDLEDNDCLMTTAPFGITRLLEDLDSGLSTLPDKNQDRAANEVDYLYSNGPPSLSQELENSPEFLEDRFSYQKPEVVTEKKSHVGSSVNSSEVNNVQGIALITQGDNLSNPKPSLRNRPTSILESPDRTYKVVLAGDAAVGKSTFISRICSGVFVPNMASTLGVDYKVKSLRIDDKNMVVQLWDTAGQERFRSITKCYFRRADGVLLLYDVINEKSFMNVRQWIQNIDESCLNRLPFVICGNKIDLRLDYMKKGVTIIPPSAGEKLARECGAEFFETSTKTGENVVEAMAVLARQMMASEDLEIQTSTFRLLGAEKKSKRCCNSATSKGF